MSEIQPSDLRISDAEREDAMRLLGEHMSVGRLDLEEYGERTAKVTAAKTRGQLLALFADLPDPQPGFTQATRVRQPTPPPAQAPRMEATPWRDQSPAQRFWAAFVPVSAIIALVLFLFVLRGFWPVFLLPAVVMLIGGSVWGDDWRRDRKEFERRMRDHRRQLRRGWGNHR